MRNMTTSISQQYDIPLEESKKDKTGHKSDSPVCSSKTSDFLLLTVQVFVQMLNLNAVDAIQKHDSYTNYQTLKSNTYIAMFSCDFIKRFCI